MLLLDFDFNNYLRKNSSRLHVYGYRKEYYREVD